ncbi:MAG: hypothetical protein ACRCTS_01640 [Fusobacteriaceae bacterium]
MKLKFDEIDIKFFNEHNEFKQFEILKEIKPNTTFEISEDLADHIRDVCLELEVSLLGKGYVSNEDSTAATTVADKMFVE